MNPNQAAILPERPPKRPGMPLDEGAEEPSEKKAEKLDVFPAEKGRVKACEPDLVF